MNYISMFSGIEAASVAWTPLGWRAIAVSEVDKFPSAVLAYHFPDVPNVGDMSTHDWSRYRGQCDIVVGGPPCQAFSVAGLRRSLDDARGNLSLSFARAIHAIGPTWAVVENVPGWLSTKDNAFGCMLAALVGADDALCSPLERGRWPSAGMVAGPLARAAWRVLDAQYFGLAQRRQRVFLVVGFGDGCDPAAVLFERESLSGNPAPSREAGEGFAPPTAPSLTASGRGVERAGESRGQDPVVAVAGTLNANGKAAGSATQQDAECGMLVPVAYGGNNTSGAIDVATALSAHAGPHGRQDFASETFIAHTLRAEGFDASEDGTGRGIPLVATPILEAGARTGKSTDDVRAGIGIGEPGDPMFTLQAGKQHAIAFSSKDHGADAGSISPTLRAMGHAGSHANAGGQVAVAFAQNQRNEVREMDIAGALASEPGMKQQTYLHHASAVRRLTPRECERLQGFPDDYTLVPLPLKARQTRVRWSADGPRYKALGNSMAVPVMVWIGQRIELVERLAQSNSEAA